MFEGEVKVSETVLRALGFAVSEDAERIANSPLEFRDASSTGTGFTCVDELEWFVLCRGRYGIGQSAVLIKTGCWVTAALTTLSLSLLLVTRVTAVSSFVGAEQGLRRWGS